MQSEMPSTAVSDNGAQEKVHRDHASSVIEKTASRLASSTIDRAEEDLEVTDADADEDVKHSRKRELLEDEDDTTLHDRDAMSIDTSTERPRININTEEVRRRGQRLFGVVLGTLNEFRKSTQQKTEAELKREELEKRLRERLVHEKTELQERIEQEQRERREQILEMRRKAEEERRKESENCINQQRHQLAGFLRTSAQPTLFYLPAQLLESQKLRLEVQRSEAQRRVEQRKTEHGATNDTDMGKEAESNMDEVVSETELMIGSGGGGADSQPEDIIEGDTAMEED